MVENLTNRVTIVEELDTTGLFCPEPVFEVKKLSERLEIGQYYKVLADDPAAEEDLKRWAKKTSTEVIEFSKKAKLLTFIFKKTI